MMQGDRQRRPLLPHSRAGVVALDCFERLAFAHPAGDPDLVVEHGPRRHQSGGRRIRQRPPCRCGLGSPWCQLQRFGRRRDLAIVDTGRPADRIHRLPDGGDRQAVARAAHLRQIGPRRGREIECGHALEDLSRGLASDRHQPCIVDRHAEVAASLRKPGHGRPFVCGRVVGLDGRQVRGSVCAAHGVHQLAV